MLLAIKICKNVHIYLVNKANLVHNLFLVYLSVSTCFGRLCAHHKEKQLGLCDTWYLLLCVDDCLVCRSICSCVDEFLVCRSICSCVDDCLVCRSICVYVDDWYAGAYVSMWMTVWYVGAYASVWMTI